MLWLFEINDISPFTSLLLPKKNKNLAILLMCQTVAIKQVLKQRNDHKASCHWNFCWTFLEFSMQLYGWFQ